LYDTALWKYFNNSSMDELRSAYNKCGVRTKGHPDIRPLDKRPPDKRPLRYIITWFRHFNFTFVYHVNFFYFFFTFIEQLSGKSTALYRATTRRAWLVVIAGYWPLKAEWQDAAVTTLSRCWVTTSVCISGYPLSGYPDLSVNFMAAKNPDRPILKWKSGCCGCLQKLCKLCLWYCVGTSNYSKSNRHRPRNEGNSCKSDSK